MDPSTLFRIFNAAACPSSHTLSNMQWKFYKEVRGLISYSICPDEPNNCIIKKIKLLHFARSQQAPLSKQVHVEKKSLGKRLDSSLRSPSWISEHEACEMWEKRQSARQRFFLFAHRTEPFMPLAITPIAYRSYSNVDRDVGRKPNNKTDLERQADSRSWEPMGWWVSGSTSVVQICSIQCAKDRKQEARQYRG